MAVVPGADETLDQCLERLERLWTYFRVDQREKGSVPTDRIAVALQGGGSKSSPFALGVLAGLYEIGLLQSNVDVVSSVSGGSYAASFLFNRFLDRAAAKGDDTREIEAGTYGEWFASCVPSIYKDKFTPSARQAIPWCDETCEERSGSECDAQVNEFKPEYKFQGHVWRQADVIEIVGATSLRRVYTESVPLPEAANTTALLGGTILTLPFHHLARTVFRWPINSAPSKAAYKFGIERQFGYTPDDWARAEASGGPTQASMKRRCERTLSRLRQVDAPLWILGASTTAGTEATGWLEPASRDALRHYFELTPYGYGSGIHGYASVPPRYGLVLECNNPMPDMSIMDGVVASAAFFDDEQALIAAQPKRLLFGATQHLANITWFSEIPNFNAPPSTGMMHDVSPWPFYWLPVYKGPKSPYIHLDDGGNSDNTGLLSVLRRGFGTIVYAHSTDDRAAQLDGLCRLKNQLEMEGTYAVQSDDLDEIARRLARTEGTIGSPWHPFSSYLDFLCTEAVSDSDQLDFGSPVDGDVPPLARLFCERIGKPAGSGTCIEYDQWINANRKRKVAASDPIADLFFR